MQEESTGSQYKNIRERHLIGGGVVNRLSTCARTHPCRIIQSYRHQALSGAYNRVLGKSGCYLMSCVVQLRSGQPRRLEAIYSDFSPASARPESCDSILLLAPEMPDITACQ
ncbi:MAG: hypothetical protein OXC07_08165 [Kistimonas sp.]|nr:hypothetical protein [Kistimonas sp.]